MSKKKDNKFNGKTVNNIFASAEKGIQKNKQESKNNKKVNKLHNDKASKQNVKQNKIKGSTNNKESKSPGDKSKTKSISNRYGVLPMSCTLDIKNIGRLDSLKQVLGLHNRNAVLTLMFEGKYPLLKSKEDKAKYKLYLKVFMMKHKEQAEKHYKQFYENSKNKK